MFERDKNDELNPSMMEREEYSGHLNAIRQDLDGLKSELANLREDAVAAGKSGVKQVVGDVNAHLEGMASGMWSAIGAAKSEFGHGAEKLRSSVNSNPLAAIGIAMAAGFVLSKFIARR